MTVNRAINYSKILNNKMIKSKNVLYVLEGFGDYSFCDLNYDKLVSLNIFSLSDLRSLNYKIITQEIMTKIVSEKSFIISKEEFNVCSSKIELSKLLNIYDYSIVNIYNNLFHHFYPISKKFDTNDLINQLNSDVSENEYSTIFDEYINFNGNVYASYQSVEEYENTIRESVFDVNIKERNIIDDEDCLVCSFGVNDETYLSTLIEILKGNEKNVNIFINEKGKLFLIAIQKII